MAEVGRGALIGAALAGGLRKGFKEVVSPGGAVLMTAGLEAGVLKAESIANPGEQHGIIETAATELPLAMALGAWIDKATTGHPGWERFAKLVSLGTLTVGAMYLRGDTDGNIFNGAPPNVFMGDHAVGVVEAGAFLGTAFVGNLIGDGMHQQVPGGGARPRA